MNDDLWDKVRGVCSETWKGCELVELLVILIRLRGTGIAYVRDGKISNKTTMGERLGEVGIVNETNGFAPCQL